MNRFQSSLVLGLVVVAAVAVASPATAATSGSASDPAQCHYVAQALPLPAGYVSAYLSGNDGDTRFAGVGTAADGHTTQGVIWTNGVPAALSNAYHSTGIYFTKVNSVGDGVGELGRFDSSVPLWFHNGVVQDPGLFGNDETQLTGINNHGDLVGTVVRDGAPRIAVWRAGDVTDPPEVLQAMPGGEYPATPQIADDGTVVSSGLMDNTYIYSPQRVLIQLHTPVATGIGNARLGGDKVITTTNAYGPVVFDTSGAVVDMPNQPLSDGVAVNSAGVLVDTVPAPASAPSQYEVVVNGSRQLLTGPAGERAVIGSITESGVIGGSYLGAAGQLLPAEWACVS